MQLDISCRQEAFEELGQCLIRALTSPLPSVLDAACHNKEAAVAIASSG